MVVYGRRTTIAMLLHQKIGERSVVLWNRIGQLCEQTEGAIAGGGHLAARWCVRTMLLFGRNIEQTVVEDLLHQSTPTRDVRNQRA